MAQASLPSGWTRRLVDALRVEWREVGILGRVAFLGVGVSLAVAIALGFWIPRLVTSHLLEARADLMETIGGEIAARGLVPIGGPGSDSYERFGEEVRLWVVGGETVRVKLWSVDGTILYSDDPDLVDRDFGLSEAARDALDGNTSFQVSDLSEPAHAGERELNRLIEFYVPVVAPDGQVLGLFEVEQRVDDLENTQGHVRRNVWLAIGSGIGVLSIFMGALTLASARIMNRRRREAERLLGALFRAQEEERRRTVGALHDDIGQPLYRLLYGLEGSKAKLGSDHPAAKELETLERLVREIDRTLRAELKVLHRGIPDDLDLRSSLRELVLTTEQESGLRVGVVVEDIPAVSDVGRVALLHAAREGLVNVRKHAEASEASVDLRAQGDRVVLEIRDDGKGIRGSEGLGIVTIRERLEAIGGGLSVSSQRGRGTRFRAWIPIGTAGAQ